MIPENHLASVSANTLAIALRGNPQPHYVKQLPELAVKFATLYDAFNEHAELTFTMPDLDSATN